MTCPQCTWWYENTRQTKPKPAECDECGQCRQHCHHKPIIKYSEPRAIREANRSAQDAEDAERYFLMQELAEEEHWLKYWRRRLGKE